MGAERIEMFNADLEAKLCPQGRLKHPPRGMSDGCTHPGAATCSLWHVPQPLLFADRLPHPSHVCIAGHGSGSSGWVTGPFVGSYSLVPRQKTTGQ